MHRDAHFQKPVGEPHQTLSSPIVCATGPGGLDSPGPNQSAQCLAGPYLPLLNPLGGNPGRIQVHPTLPGISQPQFLMFASYLCVSNRPRTHSGCRRLCCQLKLRQPNKANLLTVSVFFNYSLLFLAGNIIGAFFTWRTRVSNSGANVRRMDRRI